MTYEATHPYGFRPPRLPLGVAPPPPVSTVPGLPPSIAWAPKNLPKFNPADYAPQTFAANQFARWATSTMQADIAKGRAQLSQALGITLPALPSFTKSEIVDWTTSYAQSKGIPTSLEDGAKMVTALAHAQAQKLGVPPEFIAASDVVMHPPKNGDEAFAMVANLGEAYFLKYGVPLLQQELMSVSVNLNLVTQGIPIEFAVAGIDALLDGKLSSQEVAGIAVMAATYACALLLQSIGIPAPLGAILCGVIAQGLATVADDVLHSDDADTRARRDAIAALQAQRQELMAQCAAAAQKAWNQTQDYWDKLLDPKQSPIQRLLDTPLIAQHLRAAGGLRYYGRNVVTLPPGVTLPNAWPRTNWLDASLVMAATDAEKAAKAADALAASAKNNVKLYQAYLVKARAAWAQANDLAKRAAAEKAKPLYEYGFDCLWWEGALIGTAWPRTRSPMYPSSAQPYPDGCLYFTKMTPTILPYEKQSLDPAQWKARSYWTNPTLMWERCAAVFAEDPQSFHASAEDEAHCRPTMQWAAKYGYPSDAYNPIRTMVIRVTPYSDHTSAVRTKTVTVMPGALVDGKLNLQAALMFWGAIRPARVTSASMSADASDATQWKNFAYIDRSQIEVHKVDGSLTAQLNLPFNYCDTNEWAATVQTAAAASALVQQDIIRTVAWQVGADEAKRQAALTKAAADAAAAQTSAANAKVAWQNAAAASIAQQAARAQLQARAVAAARRSSGAFAIAMAARLRFQAAQASAAFQRKALIVAGGAAAGALLLWLVSRKKKGSLRSVWPKS